MGATALEDWVEMRLEQLAGQRAQQAQEDSRPQRTSLPRLVIEVEPCDGVRANLAQHPSVAVLARVCRDRAAVDAALVRSAVEVVEACRSRLLARRGWEGLELNITQERSWAAETKRAAITEIQAATGFTTREATSLITLAMGDPQVVAIVSAALQRGETSWAQVRRFVDAAFAAARQLSDEQRVLIATILFGTDAELAAPERLDPDGSLPEGRVWAHALFEAALAREVAACEGSDVSSEREKRARAHAARRAWVRVHDDGTATLSIRGPAVPVVGVWARFDHIARDLRIEGAENTFDQLVTDSLLMVLAHGHIDIPEAGALEEIPEDQLQDLVAVVNGAPRISLQVVVPVDALGVGHPICATCAADLNDPYGQDDTSPDADLTTSAGREDATTADGEDASSVPEPSRHPGEECAPPRTGHDPALRHGRGMVGEVLGMHPFFISPGHVRELFFTPGTEIYRLLTQPADGRLVERSIDRYTPDPDMRRQVRAADVYSRAPWARLTGRSLELDHVVPYDHGDPEQGGQTCERNLAELDKRTHQTKTLRILGLHINDRRDLTFTTLLGQITRSRVHDYRQYLTSIHPDDLDERRDLAAQAVYTALASRPESRRRPGPDTWLTLDHTGPDGLRRPGPPPECADLDDLLDIPEDTGGDGGQR